MAVPLPARDIIPKYRAASAALATIASGSGAGSGRPAAACRQPSKASRKCRLAASISGSTPSSPNKNSLAAASMAGAWCSARRNWSSAFEASRNRGGTITAAFLPRSPPSASDAFTAFPSRGSAGLSSAGSDPLSGVWGPLPAGVAEAAARGASSRDLPRAYRSSASAEGALPPPAPRSAGQRSGGSAANAGPSPRCSAYSAATSAAERGEGRNCTRRTRERGPSKEPSLPIARLPLLYSGAPAVSRVESSVPLMNSVAVRPSMEKATCVHSHSGRLASETPASSCVRVVESWYVSCRDRGKSQSDGVRCALPCQMRGEVAQRARRCDFFSPFFATRPRSVGSAPGPCKRSTGSRPSSPRGA